MKRWHVDGVEVLRGSDNVFADLGLPDAEKLKIKAGLVIEIRKAMRRHGLTQQEAAKAYGAHPAQQFLMMLTFIKGAPMRGD